MTASVAMHVVMESRSLENPAYREMVVRAPGITGKALPGQFVHVRLPAAGDALLRRPFSISGCDNGDLTLLFKVKGRITRAMALLAPGAGLDVLGPLGQGYRFPGPVEHAVLAGGGYGAAPLLFLASHLRRKNLAGKVTFLAGARTAAELIWRDKIAREGWLKAVYATEDGSAGFKGTVVDLCQDLVRREKDGVHLYACGPMGMLASLCRRLPDVPVQVAVENQMGCGIGVCMGCVLPVKTTGGAGYARVCLDGPVFDGATIDWAACTSG